MHEGTLYWLEKRLCPSSLPPSIHPSIISRSESSKVKTQSAKLNNDLFHHVPAILVGRSQLSYGIPNGLTESCLCEINIDGITEGFPDVWQSPSVQLISI